VSVIPAITLQASRTGAHRASMAQIGPTVLIVNGHDANKALWVPSMTLNALGLAAPAAVPTTATDGAGNVTGSVRYRTRWKDATRNLLSRPSPETAALSFTNNKVTVTRGAGAAPTGATHWIVERTTDGGAIFHPVNVSSAAPNGTVLASTTFSDNVLDGTARNSEMYSDAQGIPAADYKGVLANLGRAWLFGRGIHVCNADLTNASTTVANATGLSAAQAGRFLAASDDADGKSYEIATVTPATACALSSVYGGTSRTTQIQIASRGDKAAYSEPNQPECYGQPLLNGQLRNVLEFGDDGEALEAGAGLGEQGVLFAKRRGIFWHQYTLDPNPLTGDGHTVRVPTVRGAIGIRSLRYVNGFIYGVDTLGVWRMAPGSAPQEIGQPIAYEWRRGRLNWTKPDNFILAYDRASRTVWLFVVEGADTYAKRAYLWDELGERWVGTRYFRLGVTEALELPDHGGLNRICCYFEADPASYCRMYGIGVTDGVPPTAAPTRGTATGSMGVTTLDDVLAGAWPTTEPKLKGVQVRKEAKADGSVEWRAIQDNTATQLTVAAWDNGSLPGDRYEIGGIEALYRSPRLTMGAPDRKKKFTELWIWARYKSGSIPFDVRLYFNGSNTAYQAQQAGKAEDGITSAANLPDVQIDPSVQRHRFRVPAQGQQATDMLIEVRSTRAGVPWEIHHIRVFAEVEDGEVPSVR
jgi:hypothetical protein